MSKTKSNAKSELQKRNLLGKVKSIREISYSGIIVKEKKTANLWEAMRSFDDHPYDFPIKEKIVEEKLEKIDYTYFDKNGNIKEERSCNSDDTLITKIVYRYDNMNNKIEEIDFDSNGDKLLQCIYNYDQNNNLVKEIEYRKGAFEPLIREYFIKFDLNCDIKEKITFLNGRKVIEEIYSTMKNGDIQNEIKSYNEVGEIDYSATELWGKNGEKKKDENDTTYEYDEKGNIIEVHYNFLVETVEDYSYEFDEIGNWIKRIKRDSRVFFDYDLGEKIYDTCKEVEITKRFLEYYSEEKKWWNFF